MTCDVDGANSGARVILPVSAGRAGTLRARVSASVQAVGGSRSERAFGIRTGPEYDQQQERSHPADQRTDHLRTPRSIRARGTPQLAGDLPAPSRQKVSADAKSVLPTLVHSPDSGPRSQSWSPITSPPFRLSSGRDPVNSSYSLHLNLLCLM